MDIRKHFLTSYLNNSTTASISYPKVLSERSGKRKYRVYIF